MADGLATAVTVLLLVLTCIGLTVAWWVHRPQHNEHDPTPRVQPLFGGDLMRARVPSDSDNSPSHPDDFVRIGDRVPESGPSAELRERAPLGAARSRPVALRSSEAPARALRVHSPAAREASAGARPQELAAARPVTGRSVQFDVPEDGTLQFLPGRLEIVTGQDIGREIRFVRLPDANTPEITFGRTEGAMYRHVQLRDGTVSRLHAHMKMQDGRWSLTNLSTTNPVAYNGRILGEREMQALDDDDRIEMGEVIFRFRSR